MAFFSRIRDFVIVMKFLSRNFLRTPHEVLDLVHTLNNEQYLLFLLNFDSAW